MVDDVALEKAASIEHCLRRVREEYEGHEDELEANHTRQDALLLNLLRACETSIDLAMHWVRRRGLGVPQNSRHAFELLRDAALIDATLARGLMGMVGLRNIAIHNYRALDLDVVHHIVTERLGDFQTFASAVIADGTTDSR